MLEIRPYKSAQKSDLLAFAAAHPWWPAWSEAELMAFLGRLISGPRQVIDIWQVDSRVAVAVLLDKVSNPGHHACLEFVGAVSGLRQAELLECILAAAEARLSPEHQGIQLGQYQLEPEYLRQFGCVPYYEMYEMRCREPGEYFNHCPDERAKPLNPDDFDRYYELLCEAFRHNPDTSISEPDSARKAYFQPAGHSQIWMIWEQGLPLAFVNVVLDGSAGEIRTLGVHPNARGRGLGRALLGHALAWLKLKNKAPCRLSVAVQNQRALGLYLQMGFEVVARSECWLKARLGSHGP